MIGIFTKYFFGMTANDMVIGITVGKDSWFTADGKTGLATVTGSGSSFKLVFNNVDFTLYGAATETNSLGSGNVSFMTTAL